MPESYRPRRAAAHCRGNCFAHAPARLSRQPQTAHRQTTWAVENHIAALGRLSICALLAQRRRIAARIGRLTVLGRVVAKFHALLTIGSNRKSPDWKSLCCW